LIAAAVAIAAVMGASAAPAARPKPSAKPAPPASLRWAKTFEAALEKARAAGQPVMVDFWAEWCHYCHVLDQTTYRDPAVVQLGRGFVSVKINAEGSEAEQDVARRYLVRALPTIAFLSPGGRQLVRLNGFVPAEPFARVIREAKARNTRVAAWETAIEKDPKDTTALRELGFHVFVAMQETAREDDDNLIPKAMLTDAKELLVRAKATDEAAASPDRKKVRRILALIRRAEGVPAETETLLKEALAVAPADATEDADAQACLGEMYMHTGQTEQARAAFEKAIKSWPGTPGAARAKQQLQRLSP
jgi:thioredoxin-like negative regulator of GroEL